MSTGLVREEVLDCLRIQLQQFGSLMRGLTETEWSLPTRCTGWTVHDVCAHVAGNLTDIAEGRLRDLGSDEATSRQVENRRNELRDRILDEFDRSSAAVLNALATFND